MPFHLDPQTDPVPVLALAGVVLLALVAMIRALGRREQDAERKGPGG